jgi:hypothetical protein
MAEADTTVHRSKMRAIVMLADSDADGRIRAVLTPIDGILTRINGILGRMSASEVKQLLGPMLGVDVAMIPDDHQDVIAFAGLSTEALLAASYSLLAIYGHLTPRFYYLLCIAGDDPVLIREHNQAANRRAIRPDVPGTGGGLGGRGHVY